jgi:outer membrane protein assembly factor BamB
VYVLAAGSPKKIVAYDLASGAVMWQAEGDVRSRIAAGGDFVATVEGTQLVARDHARGAPRWKVALPGEPAGLAADRDRAYLVYRTGKTWWLAAYAGDGGRQLWKADAAGALGAPAAHGGLVYVPFLQQWLSILDGKTGEQLTRLRGIDEQISMLRVTSREAYYGSKQGVFVLDARSAAGTRARATYGRVAIPPQLERTSYGPDAYDPVQQAYSAADRARVLWTAVPAGDGPMKLSGDGYAIHYFRYVLGYGQDGELRWAYDHPRVELVASHHTGAAIAAVSASGDIIALDPGTGAVRARRSLGAPAQVLGATFDADGWAPSEASEAVSAVATLAAIARDPDARFDRVKELAAVALAKQPGLDATRALLGVLTARRAPQQLKDVVAGLLVQRRDPASLPVLTEQLAARTDFLAGTAPEALGAVARAIAALDGGVIDAGHAAAALAELQAHLDAPTTTTAELAQVIAAMAAIGGGAERLALGSHLLLYHADELGADPGWQRAIVTALAGKGGPGERTLLSRVAADPRTAPGLATAIRDALGRD